MTKFQKSGQNLKFGHIFGISICNGWIDIKFGTNTKFDMIFSTELVIFQNLAKILKFGHFLVSALAMVLSSWNFAEITNLAKLLFAKFQVLRPLPLLLVSKIVAKYLKFGLISKKILILLKIIPNLVSIINLKSIWPLHWFQMWPNFRILANYW